MSTLQIIVKESEYLSLDETERVMWEYPLTGTPNKQKKPVASFQGSQVIGPDRWLSYRINRIIGLPAALKQMRAVLASMESHLSK